jgi:hypothetical protein
VGERDRAAHLPGDRDRHLVGAGLELHEQGGHDVGPLGGSHARPRAAVERVPSGGDGAIDVGLAALGHPRDHLFGVRRHDGNRRVRRRRHPLTTDEESLVYLHGILSWRRDRRASLS